jgi:xanthine dehydrogenase large subunit
VNAHKVTGQPAPATAGVSHPHESARAQVAGGATYIDDIPEVRGTLHAAPVMSTVAHGRLRGVDASAALALPGVRGFFSAADIPGARHFATPKHDEPVFAIDRVEHVGQVVGVVVAQTFQQARHAARLVKLQIDELPALLTPQAAHAAQSYVLPPVQVARGDATGALAAAPHVISGQFEVGGQEHFYLEGQVAYVLPQEQRQWLVHSSTQHPGEVQHWVAHALGWTATPCGWNAGAWAAALAARRRRPATWRCGRPWPPHHLGCAGQDAAGPRRRLHDHRQAPPVCLRYTVGFDPDGLVRGLRLDDAGQLRLLGRPVGPGGRPGDLPCRQRLFLERRGHHLVPLQDATPRATRLSAGFGGPQGVIVIETILGDIARHLGLDPLDVRRRNLYGITERNVTHYQMPVEDNILAPLMAELERTSAYRRRRAELDAWNADSPVIKRGMALTPVKFGISFTATLFNQAGALVHVYTDGSVQVNHGGTEMGQGLNTKVAQVVADELGVPLARVMATAADTAKVPNASATAASSGTDLNGRAAQFAARRVRENLAAFVAGLDGCGAGAVQFAGGQVRTPKATRSFDEVVLAAYANRIQLWSDGFYRTPKIHYDKTTMQGRPFYYFAYGAACTEVAIDTLTGENRVLRVDILHDVGRSINPAIDIGQIEGGFVQGMGWLTTEELVWDARGRLATHAPSTYKIPATGDVPAHLKVALWPEPNREDNVFGSKAVGEPPFMLAISVWEALRDAVARARPGTGPVRMDAPATPERVLRALGGR